MKRWWMVIVLLLSLGLNAGMLVSRALQKRSTTDGATSATDDPTRPDGRIPRVVYRMADELELQGTTRDAFIAIQRTFFEQTIDARGRMAYLQDEVRREITSEAPGRETLDDILTELSVAHIDLERAFVTNLLDTRDLLDVEQERRYRHFLRRMRQVRGEVEKRFRDRWRGAGERWGPGGRRLRGRPDLGRFRDRQPDRRQPERRRSEAPDESAAEPRSTGESRGTPDSID